MIEQRDSNATAQTCERAPAVVTQHRRAVEKGQEQQQETEAGELRKDDDRKSGRLFRGESTAEIRCSVERRRDQTQRDLNLDLHDHGDHDRPTLGAVQNG